MFWLENAFGQIRFGLNRLDQTGFDETVLRGAYTPSLSYERKGTPTKDVPFLMLS